MIDGTKTAPARLDSVQSQGQQTRLRLVIREGRKRQVRRMFQCIGHEVTYLQRVRIGGLELGDLPPGEWRELEEADIRTLLGE